MDGPLRHFRVRPTRRAAVARDRRRRRGVRVASAGGARASGTRRSRAKPARRGARRRCARAASSSIATPSTRSRCWASRSFPARARPRCPSSSIGCSPSNRPTRRSASSQAIGAFEREAREAHGKPWKALTAAQATALLTKMSERAGQRGDAARLRRRQGRRRRDLLLERGRHEGARLERQRGVRAADCLRVRAVRVSIG